MAFNDSNPFYAAAGELVAELAVKRGDAIPMNPGMLHIDDDGNTTHMGSMEDLAQQAVEEVRDAIGQEMYTAGYHDALGINGDDYADYANYGDDE